MVLIIELSAMSFLINRRNSIMLSFAFWNESIKLWKIIENNSEKRSLCSSKGLNTIACPGYR